MDRIVTGARAIATIATGRHGDLWEIARPSVERYAVRHGYSLVARRDVPDLGGRPVSWAKIPLIAELMVDHDTVVWIDADVVVVDPHDDVAADVTSGRSLHVVWHDIDRVSVPNAGVIVARRSRSLHRLLRHVWNRLEHVHHQWWENAALIDVLGGDPDRGLVGPAQRRRARRVLGELPHRWNSIPAAPAPDPAFVHLAGLPFDERLAEMQRVATHPRLSNSR